MNRTEAAEKLQLNPELVRKWETDFQIPVPRDEKNRRVYTDIELEIFDLIKNLRDENGIQTIRKKIQKEYNLMKNTGDEIQPVDNPEINTGSDSPKVEINHQESETYRVYEDKIQPDDFTRLENSLVLKIDEKMNQVQNQLMIAAKSIGSLEAKLEAAEESKEFIKTEYRQSVDRLENELKRTIEAAEMAQQEKSVYRDQVEKLRQELEQKNLELSQEKSKGFLSRLFRK
jgi:DNA-binding transcriptional MerR regulator